jgi:hypothetical protein
MKRSRVRTSEARIIERHANAIVPRSSSTTADDARNAPLDPDPGNRDHAQQHDCLSERTHGGSRGLSEHDPEPRHRRREQPLELADVALPDHAEPEEDRHEQRGLRHHAGREVRAVVVGAAGESLVVPERRAEDEQPEERLHRAGEDVQVVVPELAQLGPAHGDGAVAQARGAHREQPQRGLTRAGANVCGSRGHP